MPNEKARGSGNEGLERPGIMGNVGTGSFVYDRVGGMGSEREYILEVGDAVVRREGTETRLIEGCRSCQIAYEEVGSGGNASERIITMTVGEFFFNPDAGKKTRHEMQATETNPNGLVHIRYICCVSSPSSYRCE